MQSLLYIPWLPFVGFGVALVVVGVTPQGNKTVLYIGSITAAVIALLLAVLPLPDVQKRRQQVGWVAGVLFTMAFAFVFPAWTLFLWIGVSFVVIGLLLFLAQDRIKSTLTTDKLLRYHVRSSPAVDYAGIYELRDGIVRLTHAYPDREKVGQLRGIEWQMSRFALPGNVRGQIETWDEIAARIHYSLNSLNPAFALSSQGENSRVVFDIEMGGFLYYRLTGDRFLFAATLDQSALNDNSFDRAIQTLARELLAATSTQQAQG